MTTIAIHEFAHADGFGWYLRAADGDAYTIPGSCVGAWRHLSDEEAIALIKKVGWAKDDDVFVTNPLPR